MEEEQKFNPFDFLKNRKNSVPPTEFELDKFGLFDTVRALSMCNHANMSESIAGMNTLAFSRLSKKVQCMAFTAFDGMSLYGKWAIPNIEQKRNTKALYQKIMAVLECTLSDAESYVKNGLVDMAMIDRAYEYMFEPDNLLPKRK